MASVKNVGAALPGITVTWANLRIYAKTVPMPISRNSNRERIVFERSGTGQKHARMATELGWFQGRVFILPKSGTS